MERSAKKEDLFESLRVLVESLEEKGEAAAAAELQDGMASLNGLTDGWAALMESMDRVLSDSRFRLSPGQRRDLSAMLKSVQKIVFRS